MSVACVNHVEIYLFYTFLLKGKMPFHTPHYNAVMLVPGVNSITNTDSQPDRHIEFTWKTNENVKNARILTFDPVSFIEADFSLSLGRVCSGSYKDSSWDGAVEASPLACGLSSCAGWGRPGWEGAEGGAGDLRQQLKTQSCL